LKNGVSHIYCKFHRPFWLLVLSVLILLSCLIAFIIDDYKDYGTPVLIAGIIISIVFFLGFYFNKSIAITVETNGSTKYGIKFKPSFIEGQDVNLKKAKEVVEVIQNQIIKEQS
jgi:hypothetical protein